MNTEERRVREVPRREAESDTSTESNSLSVVMERLKDITEEIEEKESALKKAAEVVETLTAGLKELKSEQRTVMAGLQDRLGLQEENGKTRRPRKVTTEESEPEEGTSGKRRGVTVEALILEYFEQVGEART